VISEIIFAMPPKRLAERLRHSPAKLGGSFESHSPRQILKQLQTPITAIPLSDTSKRITEPVDFATPRSTLK
jgi:hypothetical protein